MAPTRHIHYDRSIRRTSPDHLSLATTSSTTPPPSSQRASRRRRIRLPQALGRSRHGSGLSRLPRRSPALRYPHRSALRCPRSVDDPAGQARVRLLPATCTDDGDHLRVAGRVPTAPTPLVTPLSACAMVAMRLSWPECLNPGPLPGAAQGWDAPKGVIAAVPPGNFGGIEAGEMGGTGHPTSPSRSSSPFLSRGAATGSLSEFLVQRLQLAFGGRR